MSEITFAKGFVVEVEQDEFLPAVRLVRHHRQMVFVLIPPEGPTDGPTATATAIKSARFAKRNPTRGLAWLRRHDIESHPVLASA